MKHTKPRKNTAELALSSFKKPLAPLGHKQEPKPSAPLIGAVNITVHQCATTSIQTTAWHSFVASLVASMTGLAALAMVFGK